MSLRLLLGGLLLAASCTTQAFESWEHKQLGDLSYHIGLNIYCQKHGATAVCTSRKDINGAGLDLLFDPLLAPPPNQAPQHNVTYGDVVMCVDFFLTPDKLIAGRERDLINDHAKPAGVQGEAPPADEAPRLFPTSRSQLDLDQASRCNDSLTNLEGLRASHVNHTHFQAELLVAQRQNHLIALSMRTIENNLFSALVMNAISDHFLQDSFAPGHIATWRSRLTDLAANAYHDKVNREGWSATILRADLQPITARKGADLMDQVYRELADHPKLRNVFFEPDRPQLCPRDCRPIARDFDYAPSLNELYTTIQNPNKYIGVSLRGDSDLWGRHQDKQRFIMLLFEVRSILDVLESHPSADDSKAGPTPIYVVDSFKTSGWQWHFLDNATPTALPKPTEWLSWRPSVIQANIGPMAYGTEEKSGVPFSPYAENGTLKYTSMDPVFGVSAGADNMLFGDAQTRYVLNLETVVWGKASARRGNGLKTANYAITAGVQPYISRDDKNIALVARGMAVFPAIETTISVPFRMLHIKTNNGHSEWLPTVGLRLDAGFTSFLTFYLQGNYDAAGQRNGSIRRGLSLGAGLQLAAPMCRIWPFQTHADECSKPRP